MYLAVNNRPTNYLTHIYNYTMTFSYNHYLNIN